MTIELMDSDGENRAVRAFLLLYGTNSQTTVGEMRNHMVRSGYPLWPKWACAGNGHLTKSGAQSWLRCLLALEPDALNLASAQVEISRLRGALEKTARALELAAPFADGCQLDDAIDITCGLNTAREALRT